MAQPHDFGLAATWALPAPGLAHVLRASTAQAAYGTLQAQQIAGSARRGGISKMDAPDRRSMLHQSLRWQDLLWDSVLDEFTERSPAIAREVREVVARQRVRALVGHSTRDAAIAWPHLDGQARADWIWVQQFVHRVWFRGALAAERTSIRHDVAATTYKRTRTIAESVPASR